MEEGNIWSSLGLEEVKVGTLTFDKNTVVYDVKFWLHVIGSG